MTRKSILAATVAALAHTAATLSVSGALRRAAVEVAVARGSHGMHMNCMGKQFELGAMRRG